MTSTYHRFIAAGVLLLAMIQVAAFGQSSPSPPALLNPNGTSDTGADANPTITTDGAGTWVAVWQSNEDLAGTTGSDSDIFYSRSSDNGTTWSPTALLNTNGTTDAGADRYPIIRTDGAGVWITVWQGVADAGGSTGDDGDILFSRSTDGAASWSPPALLNLGGSGDIDEDHLPTLAANGTGTWVVTWRAVGNFGAEYYHYTSRSTDDGVSWGESIQIYFLEGNDFGDYNYSTIGTDGAGDWVIAWSGYRIGSESDRDILVVHSSDDGNSWTSQFLLNSNGTSDSASDSGPTLTTNGAGLWMVAWHTSEDIAGSGNDSDIFVSRSFDLGVTWTTPALLNSNGTIDSANDTDPILKTDGLGNWVSMWKVSEGANALVYMARSSNNGVTWSAPHVLDSEATVDLGGEIYFPSIAANGAGNWIATWASISDLSGTAGTDSDIVFTRFTLAQPVNTSLSGRILAPGGTPVTCAAIEAVPQGGGDAAIAVTDLNGIYFFDELAPLLYDIRIFAPDFGENDAGSVDLTGGPLSEVDFAVTPSLSGRVVRGQVTDSDTGEPLVGVLAEALFQSTPFARTYTCASGEYLLVLPPNPPKGSITVDLRFSLGNYETQTVENLVVSDTGTEVNEDLVKSFPFPATLTGIVFVDTSDPVQPVSGARITLRGPANVSTTTNTNGLYLFPAILEGTYTLAASADGYESQAISKSIEGDAPASESVALIPVEETDGLLGDINGDQQVDAVDIQLVINGALGIDIGGVDADVNGDNAVNAVDVQLVINAALGIEN